MSFTEENCSALGDFGDDSFALNFCNDTQVKTLCFNACQILTCDEETAETNSGDLFYEICTRVLTFFLLAGFAATVDATMFFENFKSRGVYLGLFSQFFIMPFLGFWSVFIFKHQLTTLTAVMIILLTSCPGGAYSNWFCSMFNADLSLSVAMTTTATLCALFMLPLNTFVYLWIFGTVTNDDTNDAESLVRQLPYTELFITLSSVIAGVVCGLLWGKYMGHKWQRRANILGNLSGIFLQALGLFASGTSCSPPWDQSAAVFVATFLPLGVGMATVFLLTSLGKTSLPKPQRVAVVIEAGYQNTGIAVAVALSLGTEGRAAAVVPILYGTFQAICFFAFCGWSVWAGWTLTPPKMPILRLLFDDFQELVAVHPAYKTWRMNHPRIADNYTEEELMEMKKLLGIKVGEDIYEDDSDHGSVVEISKSEADDNTSRESGVSSAKAKDEFVVKNT